MIKRFMSAILLTVVIGGAFTAIAVPSSASAACNSGFLGFPAWYDGLTVSDSDCNIKIPKGDQAGLSQFIWRLALNVLQIALVAVAYIAVYFIMYGGFQYMTSRGTPDGIAKGKASILHAVVGLIIAMASIGLVKFIINGLGGLGL
jgi:hypothetical protein